MKPLRKINREMLIFAVAVLVALLFTAMPVLAKVTGPCVNCHTMHNSQDGAPMAIAVGGGPQTAPNESLLIYGCVGCHSGPYVIADNIPKFLSLAPITTTEPDNGDTSAAGNFYWVATAGDATDSKGHNVVDVAAEDVLLGVEPPGWVALGTAGPHATAVRGTTAGFTTANRLTCAGTYGCHGDPSKDEDFAAISGGHHGEGGTGGFCDGVTTDGISRSYRFIYGIKGVEDPDWEYSCNRDDHNQYHGNERTGNTATDKTTISHLCCECHGDFHVAGGTAFASPWIRHPTDFDMNSATGSEYGEYNIYGDGAGASAGHYSVLAPVGSVIAGASDTDGSTLLVKTDVLTSGNAIVTCISCHRAHGSEYPDLLRWDYEAGTTAHTVNRPTVKTAPTSGCFVCHTTKDAI